MLVTLIQQGLKIKHQPTGSELEGRLQIRPAGSTGQKKIEPLTGTGLGFPRPVVDPSGSGSGLGDGWAYFELKRR